MNNNSTVPMTLTGAMVVFTKFAVSKGLEANLLADNSIQLISFEKDTSFTIDIHASGIQLYQGSINSPRRTRILSTRVHLLNIVNCVEITTAIEDIMTEWDVVPSQFYFDSITELIKNNVDMGYVSLSEGRTSVNIPDPSTETVSKFIDIVLIDERNIIVTCANGEEDTMKVEIINANISYDDLGMYCNLVLAFIKKVFDIK